MKPTLALATVFATTAVAAFAQNPMEAFKGKVKEGLYAYKIDMDMGQMPGIPAALARQTINIQNCVTKQDIESGQLGKRQEGKNASDCQVKDFRMSGNTAYRLGFAIAILLGLLLVWINLAVGIIGGEGNAANLVFAGVLLVGAVGAVLGRLRAAGMARAMVASGIAQLLAGGYAWVLGSMEGGILSAIFAALWFASAALFRRAALQ